MGSLKSPRSEGQYMLYRPEKIRVVDALSLLILRRRRISGYKFVERSDTGFLKEAPSVDPITALTLVIQAALLKIAPILKLVGLVVEFILNFLSLNGGILGIIWHILTVSLKIPLNREAADFRTILGHIDGRTEFNKSKTLINYFPFMDPETYLGDVKVLDLTMMAAKIAYENAAFVQNVVTNTWKMEFVGFYQCYNKFLSEKATQAFIFCNKAQDADVIVVAFRGTEPFNAQDWVTDVDLSWLDTGSKSTGHIHVGFLKALGLQDEKNFVKGFPKEFNSPPGKPAAYYTLRDTLRTLLAKHKNAKILVTGHSLGGALAAIFPGLLAMHEQHDILNSLHSVVTYGQPRVGDGDFGGFMGNMVNHFRVVYRYDIVPRIPWDVPPIAMFKHYGTCIYFDGWYKGKEMDEVPNPNYFGPTFVISMYANALGDLFKGIFIGWTQGKDYKESLISILYRGTGLILPGIASHSPRDYLNGARLAKITYKEMV